jgi:hypothetical protein
MEDRQEILNKINVLNYLGFNIIEVIHSEEYSEFYNYLSYESPSQFTNELVIKGRLINGLIKKNDVVISKDQLQQNEALKTKLETLPIYSKRYSKGFKYIVHLTK